VFLVRIWYDYPVNTKDDQSKFIEKYNLLFNVPNNKASQAICERYRNEHTNEFKNSGWSIEKHRKKFMDWMSGQTHAAQK
ncbi:MAG: hypothetical protein ABH810_02430, partial [bacterium]